MWAASMFCRGHSLFLFQTIYHVQVEQLLRMEVPLTSLDLSKNQLGPTAGKSAKCLRHNGVFGLGLFYGMTKFQNPL